MSQLSTLVSKVGSQEDLRKCVSTKTNNTAILALEYLIKWFYVTKEQRRFMC